MRTFKSAAFYGSLCLGLVAAPAAGQLAERPAAAAPAEPVVKLIDAGAAPRRELRFKFTKGAVETVTMEMTMAMKIAVAGQPAQAVDLPTMVMDVRLETTEVLPNGDARVTMEFVRADVLPKAGAPEQLVAQLRQSLAGVKGIKGRSTITTRGESKDAAFEVPPDADPQVRESIKNAEQQVARITPPLPADAVGQGASWSVTQAVDANNLKINQTATYALKAIDDKGATLDIAIRQEAPRQQMQGGNAAGMTLERMTASGGGASRVDFGKVIPREASANMQVTMVMSQGEQKMDMGMKLDVTMRPQRQE